MRSQRRLVMVAAAMTIASFSARAETLFADLGGKQGIERLVDRATTIWTTDSRIAPTFEDTNIVRFKRLLVDQICSISGGDCQYSGRSMAEAHKGLHLRSVHFNILAEDLQVAMAQLDIAYSVQNRLLSLLAPMHRDVVTR